MRPCFFVLACVYLFYVSHSRPSSMSAVSRIAARSSCWPKARKLILYISDESAEGQSQWDTRWYTHVSLQSTHGPYTRVFETSLARPGLLPRCVHDHSTRARPTTRSAARGVWRAHTETPRRARGIKNPYIYVASIFRPLHPMPNQFLKQMVMPSHPPRSSPLRRSPPHA